MRIRSPNSLALSSAASFVDEILDGFGTTGLDLQLSVDNGIRGELICEHDFRYHRTAGAARPQGHAGPPDWKVERR
jgi:hypothetical protein